MALTEQAMVDAVHNYVTAFERSDPQAVADLFAADARIEDPVGSTPKIGTEEILAFYTESMATGAKLTLQGPVRVAPPHAAFAFQVDLDYDGKKQRIDVIDIFRFDSTGKVASMTAYFGRSNMQAR